MGMLTDTGSNRMTGASVALRVLAEARAGRAHRRSEILERSPAVLALTGPRVAPAPELPGRGDRGPRRPRRAESCNDNGILREALRLRVRWVQELSGRAAWELGVRLAAAGDLTDARADPPHDPRARRGRRHQAGGRRPGARRRPTSTTSARRCRRGSSCPTWARPSGRSATTRSAAAPAPAAASAAGRSPTTPRTRPPGRCSSPRRSHPGSARCSRGSKGIVAETGSVLSHLAILAREAGRAHGRRVRRRRWTTSPEGAVVEVDGDTGRVTHRGQGGTA